LLDSSDNSMKFDYDERYGWHFYCTNKRASTFKEKLSNIGTSKIHVKDNHEKIIYSFVSKDFSFRKKDKSSTLIEFSYIKELSQKLVTIQRKLISLNKEYWKLSSSQLYSDYHDSLKEIYLFLSDIDVSCSGAKCSIKYGYHRPIIQESDNSFCHVQGIRHPIVERIHDETEYIANDIELGNCSKDGILLFGTNACGKSTFMKSIGLNIILAQAGFYVAASSFIFKPYTQIFTRILNNDNIFRAQSSFAVEIQELKSILSRSDSNSLVLGDELCSGTESISALSIITAGLHELCQRKSTFIFTSHLHQLTTLPEIKELSTLAIYHLKIDYDKETNILSYDRKLAEGSGPSIYGLKVCEAMGLSSDFISYAKQIQNRLEDSSTCSIKQSAYHSGVFMDHCEICGSKEKLETHHIKDQQFADENQMIDNHHKNMKFNLVPLCSECHLKVTNHQRVVTGWKQTSKGKQLEWYDVSSTTPSHKKTFSPDVVSEILSLQKNVYSSMKQTDFVKTLELKHNITISISTLRKMIKGTYLL